MLRSFQVGCDPDQRDRNMWLPLFGLSSQNDDPRRRLYHDHRPAPYEGLRALGQVYGTLEQTDQTEHGRAGGTPEEGN